MTTICLAHTPDMLAKHFGERALAALRELGDVRLNQTRRILDDPALFARAAGDCRIVVADRHPPPAAFFAAMPDLLAIFRVGVDIRSIDVDAASQDGILVTRATPGFVNSVAELAIGMMIDLGRHVSYAVGSYRAGQAPTPRLGRQLYGATLGIIGYGAVGQRLAGLAQTLAMSVLVNDPFASNFAAGLQLSAIRLRGSGLLWLRLARWRRSLCPWLPLRVICAAR